MAEELCSHMWKLIYPSIGNRTEVSFGEFRKLIEAKVKNFPESEVLELLEWCGYIDLGRVGYVRILRSSM